MPHKRLHNNMPLALGVILSILMTGCQASVPSEVLSPEADGPSGEISSVISVPESSDAPEASSDPGSSEAASSDAPSSQAASSESASSSSASSKEASSAAPSSEAKSSPEPAPSSDAPAKEAPPPSSAPLPAPSSAPSPDYAELSSEEEPASSQTAEQKPLSPCGSDEGIVEKKLFDLVNGKRAELGLAVLKWNDTYHHACHIRAKELPTLFEHARIDGRSWATVFPEVGLPSVENGGYYRENLDMGTNAGQLGHDDLAQALYQAWIDSPKHYENIIASDVTLSAICVIYDGYDVYAVQEFGN